MGRQRRSFESKTEIIVKEAPTVEEVLPVVEEVVDIPAPPVRLRIISKLGVVRLKSIIEQYFKPTDEDLARAVSALEQGMLVCLLSSKRVVVTGDLDSVVPTRDIVGGDIALDLSWAAKACGVFNI
jgi:hypothetical protein